MSDFKEYVDFENSRVNAPKYVIEHPNLSDEEFIHFSRKA